MISGGTMTVRARMVFCYIVVRQAAGLSKSLLANLVLYITRLGRLAACRTCAVLAMTLLAVVQSMAATPRERSFQVEYVATIKDLKIESPYPYRTSTAQYGNRVLHISLKNPQQSSLTVCASMRCAGSIFRRGYTWTSIPVRRKIAILRWRDGFNRTALCRLTERSSSGRMKSSTPPGLRPTLKRSGPSTTTSFQPSDTIRADRVGDAVISITLAMQGAETARTFTRSSSATRARW